MHASLRCSTVIEEILSANPDLKLPARGSYWIMQQQTSNESFYFCVCRKYMTRVVHCYHSLTMETKVLR